MRTQNRLQQRLALASVVGLLGTVLGVSGLGGCGDDSVAEDFSSKQDLSVGTSCSAILSCIKACTAADGESCSFACLANGSPSAQNAFYSILACTFAVCSVLPNGSASADGFVSPCDPYLESVPPSCIACAYGNDSQAFTECSMQVATCESN